MSPLPPIPDEARDPETGHATMSSLPDDVPQMAWPYDRKGYLLSPGGVKYRRLASVDTHGDGLSVICFVEPTPHGDVYHCPDGWKRPRRVYKTGEWEHLVPFYEAALAAERGEGPATHCAPRWVPADEQMRPRPVEGRPTGEAASAW